MSNRDSNPHYQLAAELLAGQAAQRSGVPYLAHVDEGIRILEAIGASQSAIDAFCLHPLFQGDGSLVALLADPARLRNRSLDPVALVLVMEYRSVANRYLSQMTLRDFEAIELSPLAEVNQMLIADKIQNRKDFEKHNRGHPRADHLERYFSGWLRALGVTEARYQWLVEMLEKGASGQPGTHARV